MPDWIQRVDDLVLAWFRQHRTSFLTHGFQDITALGSATILALVALFAAGILVRERFFARALLLVLIAVGSYFASEELKGLVDRPRPPGPSVPHSASFPSSHALRSMAVLLPAALALRRSYLRRSGRQPSFCLVLGAVVLIVLVGVSRLYLGVHYLSDVVGGWLVGLSLAAVYALADRWLPPRADTAPGPLA